MADWNIATGEEQPLNRTGIENVQVSGSGVQGTLVGVTQPSGATETGLWAADAASGADIDGDGTTDGPLKALGVLLPREVLPADMSNVNTHPWDDVEKQIYKEERTLTGDRTVFIKYGIEMVNDDDDTSLTSGEPVYLDKGGGFTQDLSSHGPGDLIQKVGVALDPMNEGPYGGSTKDRIMLNVEDVDTSEAVVAEDSGDATFSGDGATATFSISHDLSQTPSEYDVTPTSSAAAADHYVTPKSSSLDVTFLSAPSSGTDNVTFNWTAEE